MSIYRSASGIYGEENFKKIVDSKILVVGAGGIGCEILKNLAFSGCRNIELIDLDTIDVSNLNRQFLFRPEHVGQPKAIVAGKAAEAFNPDIKVTSYHDNIKSPRFSVSYISKFNVVLNALDNIDARRHVNRLCLAANVPLIDSGTTGYLGQVMPIIKGKTACYECFPKPTQKVYPICTIRSTPDKPVHCIVWAKECFKLLFGTASESMLFEDPSSGESSTYMHLVTFPSTETETGEEKTDALLSFGQALVTALYDTEIQKRIGMDVYKTAKVLPVLLSADLIAEAVVATRSVLSQTTPSPSQVSGWDQRVPSLSDCIVEVLLSLHLASSDTALGHLSFDKDALWTMKFVAAAANLRAHIFTIPLLSFHDAKGIAGNIIPAIATTNAIVAGVQVMQALRLISAAGCEAAKSDDDQTSSSGGGASSVLSMCPHTYCLRLPTRKGYFLQPSTAESPVTGCFVCGTAQLTLQIDVHANTLQDLVTKVLKGRLGFNEPSVMLGSCFLYEEGDGADEDLAENLPLLLSACPAGGIQDGALLSLEDFTQKLEIQVLVQHVSNEVLEKIEAASADLFLLEGQDALQRRVKEEEAKKNTTDAAAAASTSSGSTDATTALTAVTVEEQDDCILMDEVQVQMHEEGRTSTALKVTKRGFEGEKESEEVREAEDTHKKRRVE